MSRKTVRFARPAPIAENRAAQAWIANTAEKAETKRLTIDVPPAFHRHVKLSCVERGETLNEALWRALEAAFPDWRAGGPDDRKA